MGHEVSDRIYAKMFKKCLSAGRGLEGETFSQKNVKSRDLAKLGKVGDEGTFI
jgi:hypothetical protein